MVGARRVFEVFVAHHHPLGLEATSLGRELEAVSEAVRRLWLQGAHPNRTLMTFNLDFGGWSPGGDVGIVWLFVT